MYVTQRESVPVLFPSSVIFLEVETGLICTYQVLVLPPASNAVESAHPVGNANDVTVPVGVVVGVHAA